VIKRRIIQLAPLYKLPLVVGFYGLSVIPSFATDISIDALRPIDFGAVPISSTDNCKFLLSAKNTVREGNKKACNTLGTTTFTSTAQFEVKCESQRLIRIEAFIASQVDGVKLDLIGDDIVVVDNNPPNGRIQIVPCDIDGVSRVTIGAALDVSNSNAELLSHEIGFLSLEVSYEN